MFQQEIFDSEASALWNNRRFRTWSADDLESELRPAVYTGT